MAYNGKRAGESKTTQRRPIRPWITACLLLLLLSGSIVGTIAYMQAHSHLGNTFTVANLTVKINETFNGKEKSNVTVENTGDVPAYLRAAIVVNWKDADGNVISADEADYSMTMGSEWIQGADGYWYCKKPIDAGQLSTVLIVNCKPVVVKEGQRLCVDILAQGVQAAPTSAVQELWGVTVDSAGSLTPPTAEGGETP